MECGITTQNLHGLSGLSHHQELTSFVSTMYIGYESFNFKVDLKPRTFYAPSSYSHQREVTSQALTMCIGCGGFDYYVDLEPRMFMPCPA